MTSSFVPFGYHVSAGFLGFLPDGSKLLFPTQDEYYDFLFDLADPNN